MCTIGRTPAGTAGKAHHRTDRTENPVRGEQGRTDYGSKRGRNSFLSTPLTPIAQGNLVVDTYDGDGINVITRENYEFLRDSFFNYARLLQTEAVHTPGNSIHSIPRIRISIRCTWNNRSGLYMIPKMWYPNILLTITTVTAGRHMT